MEHGDSNPDMRSLRALQSLVTGARRPSADPMSTVRRPDWSPAVCQVSLCSLDLISFQEISRSFWWPLNPPTSRAARGTRERDDPRQFEPRSVVLCPEVSSRPVDLPFGRPSGAGQPRRLLEGSGSFDRAASSKSRRSAASRISSSSVLARRKREAGLPFLAETLKPRGPRRWPPPLRRHGPPCGSSRTMPVGRIDAPAPPAVGSSRHGQPVRRSA